ncbi:MAG: Tyrosine-protein phosphatase CpsB [Firmicutes bacterium ADurb.Bin193]|nr:MAG: Tyrosine-protein phosphatase CpsB [Firmicutes bacterium ADurb.Bin193]
MVDLHSHILPALDDGAKDVDEALQMLRLAKTQGVDTMVATPHYHSAVNTIDTFIQTRNAAYLSLINTIETQEEPVPEIMLGAEVYLTPELAESESLNALCMGRSKGILLEMPYDIWYDWVYKAIYQIAAKNRVVPVMAHLERYSVRPGKMESIEKLIAMNVYIQINAASLFDHSMWKTIKRFFVLSDRIVLASDAHDMADRISLMDQACDKIAKKFGKETLQAVMSNADRLLLENR